MSLFTKNPEKLGRPKIGPQHYDFSVISNELAGAPKNVKICLYCIGYAGIVFSGDFLTVFYIKFKFTFFVKFLVFTFTIKTTFF